MHRTLLFDRSDRIRLLFSGPQAVATLNGLVTNDVASLKPGGGVYAAALTTKGKMIADLRIFMQENSLLVDTSARGGVALRDMFKKYVNPRFAHIADVSATLSDLAVFGDDAARVVAAVTALSDETLVGLDAYSHVTVSLDGEPVIVVRVPEIGMSGYELFVPSGSCTLLHDALHSAGAAPAGADVWHALRVAAGSPEWGVDMDENTLPQEANLDALNAVSYNKGCYLGQETVARIHFRGHVNRTLRRLAIDASMEPPSGAELVDDSGKVVGDVRSVARVAIAGATSALLGIGMVRREIEEGATLTARWSGAESPTRVLEPATGNAKGATD